MEILCIEQQYAADNQENSGQGLVPSSSGVLLHREAAENVTLQNISRRLTENLQ